VTYRFGGRFAMSAHQKTVVLRRLQVFKSHSEPWLQPRKGVFRQNHENDLNLPRGSEKQFFYIRHLFKKMGLAKKIKARISSCGKITA